MSEFRRVVLTLFLVGVLLVGVAGVPALADDLEPGSKRATSGDDAAGPDSPTKGPAQDRINAVIYPFQSATIGSEVRGILQAVNYKEGQVLKEGDVLAEVSKPRYEAIVGEFRGNYVSIKESLERAKEDLKTQQQTHDNRATTYQQLIRVKYEVSVLEGKLEEAENKLKQAELNLEACVLKAPFSGAIAVVYKEAYETVDYLEKVVEIVDTSKVYARINWPEARLSEVALGKKISFRRDGKVFEGVVEKMSALIDPGSKSKRIHVVIDNADHSLQIGMSGTATLSDATKRSSLSGTAIANNQR